MEKTKKHEPMHEDGARSTWEKHDRGEVNHEGDQMPMMPREKMPPAHIPPKARA